MDQNTSEAGNGVAATDNPAPSTRRVRGPGRQTYIKSDAERRRTDKRHYRSIQTKFDKWLKKTGLPAVALTLHKDRDGQLHVKFLGAPAFAEFACNEVVKDQFMKIALNIMQEKNLNGSRLQSNQCGVIHPFVVDTFKKYDLQVLKDRFAINDKRKLITQAVLGNDEVKRKIWQEELRPSWWPEHVPFCSPNAASRDCSRPRVATLDIIIEACYMHVMTQITSQGADHVASQSEDSEDQGERREARSNVEDDGVDLRGRDEVQRAGSEGDAENGEGRDGSDGVQGRGSVDEFGNDGVDIGGRDDVQRAGNEVDAENAGSNVVPERRNVGDFENGGIDARERDDVQRGGREVDVENGDGQGGSDVLPERRNVSDFENGGIDAGERDGVQRGGREVDVENRDVQGGSDVVPERRNVGDFEYASIDVGERDDMQRAGSVGEAENGDGRNESDGMQGTSNVYGVENEGVDLGHGSESNVGKRGNKRTKDQTRSKKNKNGKRALGKRKKTEGSGPVQQLSAVDKFNLEHQREATTNYTWNPNECEMFLEEIRGCPKVLIGEYAKLLPTKCPQPTESQVFGRQVQHWYRHLAPQHLLEAGREPVNVKADGTCLFRSVSTALYGDERNWCWVKLAALRYGMQHEEEVMKKLLDLKMDSKLLSYLITTDDIANGYDDIENDDERLRLCAREETLRTVSTYRYGSLLHLFLIAGGLSININSFSSKEELTQVIRQGDECPNIFVMWVPTTLGRSENHVVPLVVPTDANDSANQCAVGLSCVKTFNEDKETEQVRCQLCLRSFHTYCAAVIGGYDPNHWRCFCHFKVDTLSSLSAFRSRIILTRMLESNDGEIMKFINAIAKGAIYSPRILLFRVQKWSTLRQISRSIWMLNDETEDVLADYSRIRSARVAKFRNMDVVRRVTLINSVITPEIIAFLIHKENKIPLVHARRLVIEDPRLIDGEEDF